MQCNFIVPVRKFFSSNMNTAKHQTWHKYGILQITKKEKNPKKNTSRLKYVPPKKKKKKEKKRKKKALDVACTRTHISIIVTPIQTHHHPYPQETQPPTRWFDDLFFHAYVISALVSSLVVNLALNTK